MQTEVYDLLTSLPMKIDFNSFPTIDLEASERVLDRVRQFGSIEERSTSIQVYQQLEIAILWLDYRVTATRIIRATEKRGATWDEITIKTSSLVISCRLRLRWIQRLLEMILPPTRPEIVGVACRALMVEIQQEASSLETEYYSEPLALFLSSIDLAEYRDLDRLFGSISQRCNDIFDRLKISRRWPEIPPEWLKKLI